MTDKQIIQFILHRAQQNGQPLKLSNPRLVIYKNTARYPYIAVMFDGHNEPFMLRFTENNVRAIFKLKMDNIEYLAWRDELSHKCIEFAKTSSGAFTVDYDLDTLPACVKHFVSYAIIKALQTKGMGFDMFAISFKQDIKLIDASETYEMAAIETDLMDFNFDTPVNMPDLSML